MGTWFCLQTAILSANNLLVEPICFIITAAADTVTQMVGNIACRVEVYDFLYTYKSFVLWEKKQRIFYPLIRRSKHQFTYLFVLIDSLIHMMYMMHDTCMLYVLALNVGLHTYSMLYVLALKQ